MKKLEYWLALACAWFFLFYNIEKVFGIINIDTFVYIVAFSFAMLVILVRALHRAPLYWPLLLSLPPYFFLKVQAGRPIGGQGLPLTVTEICAIWITIALVAQLADGLATFREAISKVTLDHLLEGTQPFSSGQGQVYQEIRRARRYKRPATLLAISATNQSVDIALDRLILEAQNEIIDEYISARVADLLVKELHNSDIILQRDEHFVTLLPETDRETAVKVIRRIEKAAKEKLNLDLQIGYSTFPDEAVTFETLLDNAENRMESPQPSNEKLLNLTPVEVKRAV